MKKVFRYKGWQIKRIQIDITTTCDTDSVYLNYWQIIKSKHNFTLSSKFIYEKDVRNYIDKLEEES